MFNTQEKLFLYKKGAIDSRGLVQDLNNCSVKEIKTIIDFLEEPVNLIDFIDAFYLRNNSLKNNEKKEIISYLMQKFSLKEIFKNAYAYKSEIGNLVIEAKPKLYYQNPEIFLTTKWNIFIIENSEWKTALMKTFEDKKLSYKETYRKYKNDMLCYEMNESLLVKIIDIFEKLSGNGEDLFKKIQNTFNSVYEREEEIKSYFSINVDNCKQKSIKRYIEIIFSMCNANSINLKKVFYIGDLNYEFMEKMNKSFYFNMVDYISIKEPKFAFYIKNNITEKYNNSERMLYLIEKMTKEEKKQIGEKLGDSQKSNGTKKRL